MNIATATFVVVLLTALAPPAHARDLAPASTTVPALRGIAPQHYLQKRNRAPDVSAELAALPAEVSLAILQDPSAVPFAADADYPKGLSGEERARLRALERRAVVTGALSALAASGDARAFSAIAAVLSDPALDDVVIAAVAAERLGQTRDARAVAVLAAVVADDTRPLAVRAGACAGLGRHRSPEALDALLPIASSTTEKDEVRIAALHAIANATSRWAWQARRDEARGAALRARALSALRTMAATPAVGAARDDVVARLR